jgi:L-ascorbate metabolism protein UlaG (beta-lactamase superfamily)
MRITKYAHACFTVEDNGEVLVVDPGHWTTNFVVPENVVGVIITHEHADHLNKDLLKAIRDKNPKAAFYAHEDVAAQLEEFEAQPVVANEGMKAGAFELEFFGGKHAAIKSDWPQIANLGVLINGHLYYPGDSFSVPEGRQVEILALPVAAPWMKFSEAADFLTAIKPKIVFPTHDVILSDAGKSLADSMVGGVAESVGAKYQRIDDSPLEA